MKIPVKFVESVKSAASGAVAGMSLVTLTTLVIVLSGCIPPRAGTQSGTDSANQPAAQQPQNDAQTKPAPAASPSPTPGTGLASAEALKDETFLFSLVEAGTDPALPDGGVDLKAKVRDLHLTQVRGKVVCEDLILLRHPKRQMKPQFLVWDETDAGRRVVDLSFEHRIQDSMGVVHSANHRQTASFDPITRRWYLPLAQLVRGREHDVNSGELQRVTLEVIYEGGSRRDLEVDLRISGFLPELKVQEIAANHPEVSVQAFYRTFMFGALGVKSTGFKTRLHAA